MRAGTRLTATGRAVAGAGVVLGGAAAALGSRAVAVLAAAALVAIVLAWLDTARLPDLDAEREIQPQRVDRGQPALGMLAVRNGGTAPTRACTAVESLPDRDLPIAVPTLRPGRSASIPYRLPTHRRGVIDVGPLTLRRTDPLGLWRAERPLGATTTLIVQPRVHPIEPRPTGRTAHLEGPVSETAPRGTLTFHTLREYVLGDDIRRIHWKTTARTGTLMVREHVDTSQPSTVIVLDTRAAGYVGDAFEEAVDVAASVVAASQRRGFPVRLVTTSGRVFLVRAGQRGHDLADFLAGVSTDNGDDTDNGAAGGFDRAAVGALGGRDHDAIVVVGGALDAADLARVSQTTRRFAVRALVTLRPEASAPMAWPGGIHLDAATATDALARWNARAAVA